MPQEKTTLDRIYLSDYQPPGFLITTTALHFELSANNTRVRSQLSIRRLSSDQGSLRLEGEALVSVSYTHLPLTTNREV